MPDVAKRSYGTRRLYVVVDRGGRASWYGSWWAGSTRVKRKLGIKRTAGNADGLTRTRAERELRRLVDAATVVAKGQRRTIGESGHAYIAHLENVMERERTTIADYRGYLRRHLAHPVPTPPRQGAISRRSVRNGFPSVRSIRLARWSTGPRCGLTDGVPAPCWSVRE